MSEELRRALREPHDEARAHRNWEAIARRRRRAPSVGGHRPAIAWVLVIGLASAGVVAIVSAPHAAGPLVLADGRDARGPIDGREATFDDGSHIVLDEGARLEILENTGDHVRFWLHGGLARFDVVPGGPRRWAIETGLVTVEVLGTAFSVERTAMDVTVAVERGSVLVRGLTAPDGMRRLAARESLTLPAGETVAAVEPSSAPPTTTIVAAGQEPEARVSPRSTARAQEEAEEDAEEEAEREADLQASPAPRLRDVDALRAAGHIDDAVALLDTIANDPSARRERALAAFTRGRLELDRRDRPSDAAAAFAQAIALGLREPLLEDAYARRVEALARAADADGAHQAAETYRSLHPDGRWSTEVERWSPAR